MTPEADKPTSIVDVNNHSNGGGGGGGGDGGDEGSKTPRLPRWTRHEILVLIEGKRVAEGQVRRGRTAAGSNQPEPKWVAISSYCKRHGVYREPVQCRKRWSNLAGDFRKIKEWEGQVKDESDSFWIMRNDLRRERKLPGFFDREIFDVLNGGNLTTMSITGTELVPVAVEDWKDKDAGAILGLAASVVVEDDDEEDTVFDSGRTAVPDDGLFSDFEHSKHDDEEMGDMGDMAETPITTPIPNTTPTPNLAAATTPITKNTTFPAPVPISERRYEPVYKAFLDQGRMNVKQPTLNPERGSPSREGQKRRRVSTEDGEDATLQDQLVKVLESNNKMLAAQLEAQNVNCHLDRDQRKEQGNGLIAVLNKLADALGKIADKM